MTTQLVTKNEGIFCMLNCFDNYSIVAGKIIEFYIQNASNAFFNTTVKTMSYYENTPYVLYSMYLLALQTPDPTRSKQYTDYITILSLTAVTMARIFDSRAVVYPHQGVTPQAGFATMYAYANMMNKITVYWTDDLRNLWGTSDDPLMIGMAPLPYRYLWSATPKQGQPSDMNPQYKGMNASISPNIGSDQDLCPPANIQDLEKKWNTFWGAFSAGENVTKQNSSAINKRMENLIILGRLIIQYVEIDKIKKYQYQYGNGGWIPGPGPTFNPTLFFDMENIIKSNSKLLYTEEQAFITTNITASRQNAHMPTMGEPNAHMPFLNDKKQLLSNSMVKGMQMMMTNPF